MKQVVAGLIVRGDEILICQRAEDGPMPLKWEFPGGKIEPQELAKDALRRELEEELGIQTKIGVRVAIIRHGYPEGTAVELHFYVIEHYEGEIQNRIFHDVRWVSRKELPSYDFLEADIVLIRDLASGKLTLTAGS